MVTRLRVWILFQFKSDSGAVEGRPVRWSEVHRSQTRRPHTGAVGNVWIQASVTVTTLLKKERNLSARKSHKWHHLMMRGQNFLKIRETQIQYLLFASVAQGSCHPGRVPFHFICSCLSFLRQSSSWLPNSDCSPPVDQLWGRIEGQTYVLLICQIGLCGGEGGHSCCEGDNKDGLAVPMLLSYIN